MARNQHVPSADSNLIRKDELLYRVDKTQQLQERLQAVEAVVKYLLLTDRFSALDAFELMEN